MDRLTGIDITPKCSAMEPLCLPRSRNHKDLARRGTLGQGLDAFDQDIAALDVHTGILVAVRRLAHAIMVTMPRNPGKP